MIRGRRWAAPWLAILALGVGCGDHQPPADRATEEPPPEAAWQAVAEADLTAAMLAQKERAMAAKMALGKNLLGELEAALDSGDAAAAVEVCRGLAPAAATLVAQQHGVAIGRTSHRLRNPANQPPQWARSAVEARLAETRLMVGPEHQLGVLLPIRLQAECTMCHGAVEDLNEDARQAVAELYPDDQAVGFAEGDLRGWFWVEVPVEPEEATPEPAAAP
jgi:hypothetical protein